MLNEWVIAFVEDDEPFGSLVSGDQADSDNLAFVRRSEHDPEMEVIFVAIAGKEGIATLKRRRGQFFPRRWRRNEVP